MEARPKDRITRTGGELGRLLPLAVAPFLIAASVATWGLSDSLGAIGPFDKAKIGWAVVLPLYLLAPAAAGLAARPAGARAAFLAAIGIAVVVGAATAMALTVAFTRIGCAPVSQAESALHAVPVGLAAGLAFLGATRAAMAGRRKGMFVALALGIGGALLGSALTFGVFLASYPLGVSCAYVPA